MKKKVKDYLDESKLVIRQGQQLWHLHKALKEHPEDKVISALAREYVDVGRVNTLSEGMVLAGANITAYRSTEAGERVMQRARDNLNGRPEPSPLLA